MSFLSCCFKVRKRDNRWKEINEGVTPLLQLLRGELSPSSDIVDDLEKAGNLASQNTLMMQGFEWHVPTDQRHWHRLYKALPSLKDAGVDNIWIPPGCKAMHPSGTGYDLYDLYDLGEFDQKGTKATRWGSKEDLQQLVHAARDTGIGIIWDTVLNHKAGADCTERFQAVQVDPESSSPHSAVLFWVSS